MTQPDHANPAVDQTGAAAAGPPATPRWVKISALVIGLLVLAVALKITVGGGTGHGPGMHGALGGVPAASALPAAAAAPAPAA